MRKIVLAAALAVASVGPAMAQGVVIEPPGNYYPYPPPNAWQQRQQQWAQWNDERRHQAWEEWRHARWRCDHGDGAACGWMREHGQY